MRYIFYLVIFFGAFPSYSQKEGNVWCFGQYAIVDFNSGKPVAIPNLPSGMFTRFGCANICSATGKLLFYSQGATVEDNSHNTMPNGKGLNGNSLFSTQSSLIVPWPDSADTYYIFTLPQPGVDYVYYTEINMKLNLGKGDVVSGKKNIPIPTLSTGKITAVKHPNRKDYWVVTPQYGTDTIHSYLVTSNGIISKPVTSTTGHKLKGKNSYDSTLGYMKLSPDGRKICYKTYLDSSIIADFDPSTGKVSNAWKFKLNGGYLGIEFSAKSRYLYTADYSGAYRIIQFDLSKKTKSAFFASQKTVDSGSVKTYQSSLQLAPDGKIYISDWINSSNHYLHVIHAPDSAGKKARFEKNNVYLDRSYCTTGLPDFIQSIFIKKSFEVKQNCSRDTAFFSISNTYDLDSAHWDFGDVASTNNNSTKTTNVFHSYKKPGLYSARLISFHKQFSDTIYETFFVNYAKPYLGRDTTVCYNDYIGLGTKGDYTSYKWNTGETKNNIIISKKGTFILTVTDYDGCKNADTIVIKNITVKADFSISDSGQCLKNNSFKFKETTKYTDDKRGKTIWYFSDGSSKTDTIVSKSLTKPGVYTAKLVSQSQLGCMDSIIKTFSVFANPKASFSINGSMQCFNTHSYDFKINKDTGKVSYEWDWGDQSFNNPGDIIAKKYAKEGAYKIRLIATTDKNCKDTLIKPIIVLPAPKADFSWDLACSRTITNFKYTGTKPISSFSWNLNNEAFSNLENPSQLFSTTGTKKIKLWVMADNACLDTISKTLDVKKQAKAEFEVKDVCENDSVVFNNTSKDAMGYKWRFGDGKTSTDQNTKHKYQITSSTTFNVSLVAVVNDGCSDSIGKAVTVNENPKSDFTYTQAAIGKVDFKANQAIATNYRWLFGNGDSVKVTNPNYSYTYKKSSNYNVCLKVMNTAGCQSETCKQLAITGGVYSLSKPSGFKIYPNPNSGNFTIEIENPSNDVSIEVYNSLGQIIKRIERVGKVTSLNLDLATGVYLVRVKNGMEVWNQKVIVSVGEDTHR